MRRSRRASGLTHWPHALNSFFPPFSDLILPTPLCTIRLVGVKRHLWAWKIVVANTLLVFLAVFLVVALEFQKDRKLLESDIRQELSQQVVTGVLLLEGSKGEELIQGPGGESWRPFTWHGHQRFPGRGSPNRQSPRGSGKAQSSALLSLNTRNFCYYDVPRA